MVMVYDVVSAACDGCKSEGKTTEGAFSCLRCGSVLCAGCLASCAACGEPVCPMCSVDCDAYGGPLCHEHMREHSHPT